MVPELLSDGDARYLVGHDILGWTAGAAWTYAAGGRILAETTLTETVAYLYGHDCLGEQRDGD